MKIKQLRQKIDRLDRRLLQLLNQRTTLAAAIGRLKQKQGARVFAPEREAALLRSLFKLNKGPVSAEALRAIYHEIFSSSRACQREIRVGFLGAEHGRSAQVSRARFGASTQYVAVTSLRQASEWLTRRKVEAVIAPAADYYEYFSSNKAPLKNCYICGDFDIAQKKGSTAKDTAEFYFLLAAEPSVESTASKTVVWIRESAKKRSSERWRSLIKALTRRGYEVVGWREVLINGRKLDHTLKARYYQLELRGWWEESQLSETFNSIQAREFSWGKLASYAETPYDV